METRTISVSVRIPKSYRVDLLQQQLTAYAQQLIDAAKPAKKAKRQYRHEALCGIFSSGASEEELIEDYLKDFSRADTSAMEILSPEEFAGKYL